MKKVLFVSHSASRTGAPIVLLNFLRWFKKNTSIPFKVVLKDGGELEPEFASLAPTLVVNQSKTLYHRVLGRLGLYDTLQQFRLQQFLTREEIGLVYYNTVTNYELLEKLRFLNCPIITHVHELNFAISYFTSSAENFNLINTLTTHFIACSQAVKENLVNNRSIASDRITTVYSFASTVPMKNEEILKKREEIRRQLNIPQNAFIVGGSGTIDWRKAPDLFIQLARTIHSGHPDIPIYFLWVGGYGSQKHLEHDINNLSLDQYIRFIGLKSKEWKLNKIQKSLWNN